MATSNQLTIRQFIREAIKEIEDALPDGYVVDEAIDFEISVTTTKSKDGGLNIEVFSGKLSEDKEVIHKLNFSIVNVAQKEEDLKKSSETLFKYMGKGLKEMAKEAELNDQPTQNKLTLPDNAKRK
jgi:hypothetical protein